MPFAILTIFLTCSFYLTACSTVGSKVATGQRMVVSQDSTILYRHMLLPKGTAVKLVKKEFLYSLVELSNGQMGYITNDSIVADPIGPAVPDAVTASRQPHKNSKVRKSTSGKTPSNPAQEPLPKPSFRY